MIRTIRAQIALSSAVWLLALSATAILSTPIAVAAPAHVSKKVKKHKKKNMTEKKKKMMENNKKKYMKERKEMS